MTSRVLGPLPAMPDRVARLPRDRRGYPVPHVAQWSSDGQGEIASERRVLLPGFDFTGVVVRVTDRPGEGVAQLGAVEPGRQLESHERAECNVCGERIGERLHFVGGWAEPQCYTEAPLHRECARFALMTCPALVTTNRRDAGSPLAVTVVRRDEASLLYLGEFHSGYGVRSQWSSDEAARRLAAGEQFGLMRVVAVPLRFRRLASTEWLGK